MKEWIYECWTSVMVAQIKILGHIPDTNTRHLVLQILGGCGV